MLQPEEHATDIRVAAAEVHDALEAVLFIAVNKIDSNLRRENTRRHLIDALEEFAVRVAQRFDRSKDRAQNIERAARSLLAALAEVDGTTASRDVQAEVDALKKQLDIQ